MGAQRLIFAGLGLMLALGTLPFWLPLLGGPTAPAPELVLPAEGHCIEDAQTMRAGHMKLLTAWRQAAVREGRRLYTANDGTLWPISLERTCLGCHQDQEHFCGACHTYLGVQPDCWSCHIANPLGQQGGQP